MRRLPHRTGNLPRVMLHHLSLGTRDIGRAATFYDAALAPLGYTRVWSDLRPGEAGQAVGYGPPDSGDKLAIKAHDDARAPAPASTSPLPRQAARPSMPPTRQPSPAVASTTARPACARTTVPPIMPPSSSIPMGTTSRRSSRDRCEIKPDGLPHDGTVGPVRISAHGTPESCHWRLKTPSQALARLRKTNSRA